MSSFRCLNFNDGTSINLGYITKFYGLQGYSPIETIRPTGFNLAKYKARLEERYDSHVPSAINVINNTSYSSFNEANEALDAVATYLIDNVYWLYGDLYSGGCFLWTTPGSGMAQFVQFYGLYRINGGLSDDYYEYFCGSLNVPFRVNANNDPNEPVIDNILYFFNCNSTDENAPTNHVFGSEYELRIVDSRSLNCYRGSDIMTSSVPETWTQEQHLFGIPNNTYWNGAYLYAYTDDELRNINPHPWDRWFQNRVVPNLQFFTGLQNIDGELVGGYVPIDHSPAVTYSDDDPSGGGANGPDGGNGNQNGTGDDIGLGDLPGSSFLSTGISRIYLPDTTQMSAFSNYVFSSITQSAIDQLKKMWSNPLDYIENLGICRLTGLSATGVQNISFGGIDTGVSCSYINNAFHEFSYTRTITEHWNGALDYANYTKLKIYIPYCGLYDLNVDEFMMSDYYGGCTITLTYRIDLMSGMCIAMVKSTKAQYDSHYGNLNSYLYQFNGNIFLPLSMTATDWRNTYSSVLNIAGGMIAPSPTTAVGMANDIMGQKVNVQHSGSIGTNFGYMGKQEPFLIIERPAKSEPYLNGDYSFRTNYGYRSDKLVPLKDVKGFAKVRKGSFWCQNLHATDEERKEIISLFENEGVWMG